ncbi:MAG: FmdB family zinc ribbon protein [Planctomycetaceae bacterium]
MPLFEYDCQECAKRFEVLERRAGERHRCPHCGGARLKKALSVFASATAGRDAPPPECGKGACPSCAVD